MITSVVLIAVLFYSFFCLFIYFFLYGVFLFFFLLISFFCIFEIIYLKRELAMCHLTNTRFKVRWE